MAVWLVVPVHGRSSSGMLLKVRVKYEDLMKKKKSIKIKCIYGAEPCAFCFSFELLIIAKPRRYLAVCLYLTKTCKSRVLNNNLYFNGIWWLYFQHVKGSTGFFKSAINVKSFTYITVLQMDKKMTIHQYSKLLVLFLSIDLSIYSKVQYSSVQYNTVHGQRYLETKITSVCDCWTSSL